MWPAGLAFDTRCFMFHPHTDLDVVLLQVGDDLLLVVIQDLVENSSPLAVLLQEEEAAVPVLR